ncbi:MAG TPA: hypothetical protein VK463_04035 [Desulfomonilaceae bacterium]|nr:hypothetical protein [Desulfomonilaceae bacterium]
MVRLLQVAAVTVGGDVVVVVPWVTKQRGGPGVAHDLPAQRGLAGQAEVR